jgi:hypothetical protein
MKGGYVFQGFQPISVIMNDSNQSNKVWMSYSSIKINVGLIFRYFRMMTYFHLECQNPIKNIKWCYSFAPKSFILLSKPLEYNFLINKISLIVLINASFL